jgi:hypothetical protein
VGDVSSTPAPAYTGYSSGSDGGGEQRVVIEIRSGGRAEDDYLVGVLQRAINARGGNVQVVLGGGNY